MRGSLHAPRAWMEPTPSFPPGSTGLPLPVSWGDLCSLPLPRALFAQPYGFTWDHPLCCKKSGDRITRHNRLRNLLFKLADTGLLVLVDQAMCRSRIRGLAIDVAVICPLAESHLGKPEPTGGREHRLTRRRATAVRYAWREGNQGDSAAGPHAMF